MVASTELKMNGIECNVDIRRWEHDPANIRFEAVDSLSITRVYQLETTVAQCLASLGAGTDASSGAGAVDPHSLFSAVTLAPDPHDRRRKVMKLRGSGSRRVRSMRRQERGLHRKSRSLSPTRSTHELEALARQERNDRLKLRKTRSMERIHAMESAAAEKRQEEHGKVAVEIAGLRLGGIPCSVAVHCRGEALLFVATDDLFQERTLHSTLNECRDALAARHATLQRSPGFRRRRKLRQAESWGTMNIELEQFVRELIWLDRDARDRRMRILSLGRPLPKLVRVSGSRKSLLSTQSMPSIQGAVDGEQSVYSAASV